MDLEIGSQVQSLSFSLPFLSVSMSRAGCRTRQGASAIGCVPVISRSNYRVSPKRNAPAGILGALAESNYLRTCISFARIGAETTREKAK